MNDKNPPTEFALDMTEPTPASGDQAMKDIDSLFEDDLTHIDSDAQDAPEEPDTSGMYTDDKIKLVAQIAGGLISPTSHTPEDAVAMAAKLVELATNTVRGK